MDYVTRQFINLTKKFRKELPKLAELLHRYLQQNKKAVTARDKRDKEQEKVWQEWRERILSKYDRSERDDSTRDDRNYRVQNSIRKATWCAFFAASIYAAITAYYADVTHGMLKEAQKQTPFIRSAAEFAGQQAGIAQQSLNSANQNFRTEERAWIVPNFPPHEPPQPYQGQFGTSYHSHFQMKNEGKTVAKDVDGSIAVIVLHKDEPILLSNCLRGTTKTKLGAFFPGVIQAEYPELDELMPNEQRFHPVTLDQSMLQTIFQGDRAIIGCGKISYSDIFTPPVRHYVTFCEVLEAHPAPAAVSPSGKFKSPRIYEECLKLNSIDQQ